MSSPKFSDLSLAAPLLEALTGLGYETPSPIQQACIPALLNGEDVLGMAQTGTGKTAAFALPLLQKIDIERTHPQALVLAPTRELAVQVAEALQAYARHMRGFHVLPIYGGQSYTLQLRGLKRGPHVIVGTPGRIRDHIARGTLDLSSIQMLVLDEADEMLRMGFVEEVEAIMAETPAERQTALFSATMPEQIRRITKRYMRDPRELKIAAKTSTVENIDQNYWLVSGVNKLDALTRLLETESYDGVIIFARTKTATAEVAEKLEARGYAAAALNGDMNQAMRERTVQRLKNGQLDIVVATDVAARGLDVERISLVVNYDIPLDTEAYVHRIGRTGRAGRSGKAILFVAPRERRLLKAIERATRQQIPSMDLPSRNRVTEVRINAFRERLVSVLNEDLDFYRDLSAKLVAELEQPPEQLAAALLFLAQQDKPLQLPPEPERPARGERPDRGDRPERSKRAKANFGDEVSWIRYRIEVGREDGLQVKHVVGAIANEADLDSRYIGHVKLHDDHTTVELPDGMPQELLNHFKQVRVCNKPMQMSTAEDQRGVGERPSKGGKKFGKGKPGAKKPHRKGPPRADSKAPRKESNAPRRRD
ncbi:DEAD/DEAH box helicase [Motiliproteus sediminis]|uniref:DEAD/DEAH box helicase n=1 Tax=Motiliproteus sediminis TaxID=1468178 RepID=UPI001AEFF354|nr:DEAD/DEAH box helicase [Motiliproteus sediminis]